MRDCLSVLAVVEGTGPRRCGRESCLLKMTEEEREEEQDWGASLEIVLHCRCTGTVQPCNGAELVLGLVMAMEGLAAANDNFSCSLMDLEGIEM